MKINNGTKVCVYVIFLSCFVSITLGILLVSLVFGYILCNIFLFLLGYDFPLKIVFEKNWHSHLFFSKSDLPF